MPESDIAELKGGTEEERQRDNCQRQNLFKAWEGEKNEKMTMYGLRTV